MGDGVPVGGRMLIRIGRRVRPAVHRSAAPLDYLFRLMNQLRHYPPFHLRRHVGGMHAGFNGPGYEFVAYLRLLAHLRDGDALWDIGCGCGMLELALQDLGWQGRLVGTDIHKPSIDWAQKHIGTRLRGHAFTHMDIYNAVYQRNGTLSAQEWLDRFGEDGFDVVVAKSLFTHILPDELGVYLRGIATRLKSGGKAVLTFFIVTREEVPSAPARRSRLYFQPYDEAGHCFVGSLLAPTAAVAYEQHYLLESLQDAGFQVEGRSVLHGAWAGEPDGLSFQDIVVVER